MAFTAVFSLVVLCTGVHGSKLISQHEGGSLSQKPQTQSPQEIVKHALLRKDMDTEISNAKTEVSQARTHKGQKSAAHAKAIQNEQNAFQVETQAESAEADARQKKEDAQSAESAAKKKKEILEGQTAAIVDVEAATETLNNARSTLASAKSARTKHLAAVKKAGEEQTAAETRQKNAEAAENKASGEAQQAALNLQTAKHTLMAVNTMCETAKSNPYFTEEWKRMYCLPVADATKSKNDAEDAKQAADDALEAAQKEEEDAVNALAVAKQKKIDLDKLTGGFQAAVDDAETKRAVALIGLDRAMEEAHKHFKSAEEIEGAKSDQLRREVEAATRELEAATTAKNQAIAKHEQADKDLEDAQAASKEATQNKLAAKRELEQAQVRLELAQGRLRDAQADLANARNDSKDELAKAKAAEEKAKTALNQATQRYNKHTQDVDAARQAETDAQKKLDDADAQHKAKVAVQQGSKAVLDEADAFKQHAKYWADHTEILEKEHYWDAEFGPIHQSADTIWEDKKGDYQDAKSKNDKHKEEVRSALAAVQTARQDKDEASEALSNLEAKTDLLSEAKLAAEGSKDAATYRRTVAEAIQKIYHQQ